MSTTTTTDPEPPSFETEALVALIVIWGLVTLLTVSLP